VRWSGALRFKLQGNAYAICDMRMRYAICDDTQDFIRITSAGCNQNRAGSGLPRESPHPQPPPPPAGPNGGYRLPEEPSTSRPTANGTPPVAGRKRESRERVAVFKKKCQTRRLGLQPFSAAAGEAGVVHGA
jgi:hypothetical protein